MPFELDIEALARKLLARSDRPVVSLLGVPIDAEAEAAAMSPAPAPPVNQAVPQAARAPSVPSRPQEPGTFMGLAPVDWMRLIGAVGAPFQIGTPEQRAMGRGIRPFMGLSIAGELIGQRQAMEREAMRRQVLGQTVADINAAISAARTPEEAELARRQGMGRLAAVMSPDYGGVRRGGAVPGVSGAGEFGGNDANAFIVPWDSERTKEFYRVQQGREDADATTRTFGSGQGQLPRGIEELIVAAGGNKTVGEMLRNQNVQTRLQESGRLVGPAKHQVEQAKIRQQGIEEMTPANVRPNLLYETKQSQQGLEVSAKEPTSHEQALALQTRGMVGAVSPENIKAYLEKTPTARELTPQELAQVAYADKHGPEALLRLLHPGRELTPQEIAQARFAAKHGPDALLRLLHPTKGAAGGKEKTVSAETQLNIDNYIEQIRAMRDQLQPTTAYPGYAGGYAFGYGAKPAQTVADQLRAQVKTTLLGPGTAESERTAIREALRRVLAEGEKGSATKPSAPAASPRSQGRPMAPNAASFLEKYGGQ